MNGNELGLNWKFDVQKSPVLSEAHRENKGDNWEKFISTHWTKFHHGVSNLQALKIAQYGSFRLIETLRG